jgi:hypothetical protein
MVRLSCRQSAYAELFCPNNYAWESTEFTVSHQAAYVCHPTKFMKPEHDIHALWDEAIAAKTPEELDRVIPRLRQALHDHCEDVRGKLAHYPLIARRLVRQINDLLLDQETVPHNNQTPRLSNKEK